MANKLQDGRHESNAYTAGTLKQMVIANYNVPSTGNKGFGPRILTEFDRSADRLQPESQVELVVALRRAPAAHVRHGACCRLPGDLSSGGSPPCLPRVRRGSRGLPEALGDCAVLLMRVLVATVRLRGAELLVAVDA